MIIVSLLLIAAAAVLLVVGLVQDLNLLLVASIVVSLLAAVALYVGARQTRGHGGPDEAIDEGGTRARRAPADEGAKPGDEDGAPDDEPSSSEPDDQIPVGAAVTGERVASGGSDERPDWPLGGRGSRPAGAGRDQAAPSDTVPTGDPPGEDLPGDADDVPADEPPTQRTPRGDAELVSRLPAEVLVVDGRPRYHATDCSHLLGKECEPLAVSEAVELGFSPCAWCQPDTVVLGGTPDR